MNARHLRHLRRKLRWIKPWYFLVLCVISTIVCVFALRANNQHMIVLRDAVHKADKDNTDIQKPLQALQAYVTRHMNTELNTGKSTVYPPIQLKFTYDRLVQAQTDKLTQANAGLYSEAQAHCEAQNSSDFSGRNRVPCIEQYVQSHTTEPLATVPDALYKFSFTTPRWSPDRAGWSMAAAIVSGAIFIITFATSRFHHRRHR